MSRRSTRLGAAHDASPLLIASRSYTSDTDPGPSSLPAHKLVGIDGGPPKFEEWPLAELQAQVKRYGFKTSRKRSTLVDQLRAVYDVMGRARTRNAAETSHVTEPEPEAESSTGKRQSRKLILPNEMLAESDDEGAAEVNGKAKAMGKAKGKGRKSDPFLFDTSSESSSESVILAENADSANSEEAGDYTLQLELEAHSATDGAPSSSSEDVPLSTTASPRKKTRRKSGSLSPSSSSSSAEVPLSTLTSAAVEETEDGGGEAVDPSPALAETMTTAIRSNEGLWARILRYEPISFDEFVSLATQSGISMDSGKSKEELRTWLDRQCICFYSAELTGSRSRH
ncbi:uncharacterized protein UTRI_05934 [Ustilago trichophora]|uniref:Structure-specific endonuclease subunit SLX4 n=1 Tax=Ustilago trichophora TaxID=86804 RepID=A0A5C3EJ57_9BASI|nr:uncharacterized protein UTRI_05934 [Ustilago trichophora]